MRKQKRAGEDRVGKDRKGKDRKGKGRKGQNTRQRKATRPDVQQIGLFMQRLGNSFPAENRCWYFFLYLFGDNLINHINH